MLFILAFTLKTFHGWLIRGLSSHDRHMIKISNTAWHLPDILACRAREKNWTKTGLVFEENACDEVTF